MPSEMQAVEIARFGGPEVLRPTRRPIPQPGHGEVLIQVAAAGVNRPDATQRRGLYPPPPGITDIPGLEVAGRVLDVGDGVVRLKPGNHVCALVAGGGYAQYVAAPEPQCLPIPAGMGLIDAASLPEAWFTAWNMVVEVGRLRDGESVLIQGGTSGVGMAAVQLAKQLRRARVIATAGTPEKRERCLSIGADRVIDYHDDDWPAQALAYTDGRGLDLILDAQAGDYVQREVDILAVGGRLGLLGAHRGLEGIVNFRTLIRRRLTIAGSVIRSRSVEEKHELAQHLAQHVWPLLASRRVSTLVQRVFRLEDAVEAHDILERNEQIGKLVLEVDSALVDQYRRCAGEAAHP